MIGSINLNQFSPGIQGYGQTHGVSYGHNANQNESVFTQAKTNEDSLVSSDFETDATQLKEDWSYFKELEAAVKSGDQDAIKEALSIQAMDKVDASDSNAVQLNANTDLLLKIQQEAQSASANTGDSANPFA